MVKLPGKLDYFDFVHKKRLLEEEPPNMPLLQEYVLAQLEESMDRYLSQQQSAYKQSSGENGEPHMIPHAAAAYSTETRKIVKPEFFLDLLRLQTNRTKKNNSVSDVPAYRRHLIWQVPEPCLFRYLRKRRLLDAVLGTKTTAEVASDTSPHPLAARGYALISQVLDQMIQELEKVPPESWTKDNIPLSAEKGTELWALLSAQLEPNVPPGTVDKKIDIAFSELLRWALVASDSAPSNKEVMEFLGREESLKRISTAASVARKVAEQPDWQPEGFDWAESKGR
jgi:glutamyl-tRNA synthetase